MILKSDIIQSSDGRVECEVLEKSPMCFLFEYRKNESYIRELYFVLLSGTF